MSTEYRQQGRLLRVAMILLMALAFVCIGHANTYAATSAPTASAQVNAKSGVYLRAKASTSAKKVVKVKNNAKITIIKEVFLKKNNSSTKYKWYYVKTSAGKKGYIQAAKVDNIKYSSVNGITTSELNYRVGPDTKMKRIGTFKNKALLTVVLPANVKGNSTMWYKIKKGSKYYYVCSDWVKLGAVDIAKTLVTPVNDLKPNTPGAVPDADPTFDIKDLTYPVTILEKMPFSIRGTIKSSQKITSAKFGVMNSSGKKWIISKEVTVNDTTFDILKVDAYIKFGTLSPGKYKYVGTLKIYGKDHTVVSKAFTVKKATSSQKLSAVAQQLAWPYGTAKSVYGSKPTDAYAAALDQAYPTHNTWGKGPNTGASCDVFIGTICRYSGVDTKVPRKLNDIWAYFDKNPDKWVKVPYTFDESQLVSGDIFVFDPKTSNQHICMYLKIDGKAYCAEASYPRALYGFINKSTSKLLKNSNRVVWVYRPVS